jgi:signal transduction histidine kinase
MINSLEEILENLQQGIVVLDAQLVITFFNGHALKVLGWPDGAFSVGMQAGGLVDGSSYGLPLTAHEQRQLATRQSFSFQFPVADGRIVSLSSVPSRAGGWLLTYDDVSTLVHVENSLAEQNRRIDAALKNMPHGLCMYDSETTLILCNAAYAAMYSLTEALTKPGTPLKTILEHRKAMGCGPIDMSRYFDCVIEANAKQAIASQYATLADGRVIKITHNPMSLGGYVATHEDVTTTMRISEELRQHRDALEITVQSRTAEVERQARELARMLEHERNINQLQRQFVSMASHEFRTPLTIIDGAAQRLLRNKASLNEGFVEEKVDRIRGGVSRIVVLMESILAIGRLEDGKIEITHDACALKSLIRTCCDQQAAVGTSHRFLLDLDRLPETIEADSQTLTQVFANLVSNAVKYAPDAPDVHISGWREQESVKIAIRDEGIGMDAEDLPKLFQRYFRARTSTGIAGTGIGLNLVKQIVDLHHGTIDVTSRKGQGSTFTVTLPIRAEVTDVSGEVERQRA